MAKTQYIYRTFVRGPAVGDSSEWSVTKKDAEVAHRRLHRSSATGGLARVITVRYSVDDPDIDMIVAAANGSLHIWFEEIGDEGEVMW